MKKLSIVLAFSLVCVLVFIGVMNARLPVGDHMIVAVRFIPPNKYGWYHIPALSKYIYNIYSSIDGCDLYFASDEDKGEKVYIKNGRLAFLLKIFEIGIHAEEHSAIDIDLVKAFIEASAKRCNPNTPGLYSARARLPLVEAVFSTQEDFVKILLDAGADPAMPSDMLKDENDRISILEYAQKMRNLIETDREKEKEALDRIIPLLKSASNKESLYRKSVEYYGTAMAFFERGDYDDALEWFNRALMAREEVLGKEHLDTIQIYHGIVATYTLQGDYNTAYKLNCYIMNVYLPILGAKHLRLAPAYNTAGVILYEQGNYGKALEWMRIYLEIWKNKFGEENPEVGSSYSNIGMVYNRQGNYEEAEKYLQKALAILEKALGSEHPKTAFVYTNLADLSLGIWEQTSRNDSSRLTEALKWARKALAAQEKTLGKEHPETARTYLNIGLAHYYSHDYKKSLEWSKKASAIFKKLGKEHSYYFGARQNMALVYEAQGDYEKAQTEFFDVYKTFLARFGEVHPDTVKARENLARAYQKTPHPKPFADWLKEALGT
jgi:tetratricopeptide (TPR) repeat protein